MTWTGQEGICGYCGCDSTHHPEGGPCDRCHACTAWRSSSSSSSSIAAELERYGVRPPGVPAIGPSAIDRELEAELEAELGAARARARAFARASLSPATRAAYARAWSAWLTWSARHLLEPFPVAPGDLAAYLAAEAEAGRRPVTLQRICSAIALLHGVAGIESPTTSAEVRQTLAGIRREKGRPVTGSAPISASALAAMVAGLAELPPVQRARNRALLLVGWSAALRRSELVALEWTDVTRCPEGMVILLRRSKNDQEGQGRAIPIAYSSALELCPVRALDAWRLELEDELGIPGNVPTWPPGRVFRGLDRGQVRDRMSVDGVYQVVRDAADRVSLGPFSPHSLRAGFATEAARRGVSERQIGLVTGHRSLTVLRSYIRDGSIWTDAVRLL